MQTTPTNNIVWHAQNDWTTEKRMFTSAWKWWREHKQLKQPENTIPRGWNKNYNRYNLEWMRKMKLYSLKPLTSHENKNWSSLMKVKIFIILVSIRKFEIVILFKLIN